MPFSPSPSIDMPQQDNFPSVYPGDLEQPTAPQQRNGCCHSLEIHLKQLWRSFRSCPGKIHLKQLWWSFTSCLGAIPHYLCILLCLLIPLAILGGFVLLFTWIGMGPKKPNVYIDNAFLTQFNLTTTANSNIYNLGYNLTVEVGLRNRNKQHTLCYRGIESSAYYESQRLTWASLPDFCQSSKSSRTVPVVFAGRSSVELAAAGLGFFQNERSVRSFLIDVSVYGGVKARLETVKWRYGTSLDHLCQLTVPLAINGTSLVRFSSVGCQDVSPPPPSDA